MPQSSTSTGLALMKGRSSGSSPAARLPVSAVTAVTVMVSPRAAASTCFRWSTAERGWQPMRISEPPPVKDQWAAWAAWDPLWLSSAFMNRILSLLARTISAVFVTAGA